MISGSFSCTRSSRVPQPSKLNSQASGLRFFFTITLGRADLTHQLTRTNYPRKLPRILSPDEVARLLEAAPGPGLKYKAALSIAYGAGLRVGEIVMLRISDIDSERMLMMAVSCDKQPLLRVVRWRTVAKVLSMGLPVRMCFQCSAGKS